MLRMNQNLVLVYKEYRMCENYAIRIFFLEGEKRKI